MATLDKRLEKLEAIADPKKLEPLVIYCHGLTEEGAKRFNKPAVKGNPLMVVVRPHPDEVNYE